MYPKNKEWKQMQVSILVEKALAYENQNMVSRYTERYGVSMETAKVLFEECKKFLVACAKTKDPISPPNKDVDEMWHFFILHTKDYAAFCETYFGKFIHHVPTDKVEGVNCNDCSQSPPDCTSPAQP
ncbi:MAG: hypothetical protein HYS87_03280 [Candidatus Colwellbacteria bacterium]|nr:hypothetical protein [Candidatus Colwellbacteria bacterium]